MKYQRDLKVLLQERYKRLCRASYGAYVREVKYFFDFVQTHAPLRSLVAAINSAAPDFDADGWITPQLENQQMRGDFEWPSTEQERAKLVLALIESWAGGDSTPEGFGQYVSHESDLDAMMRDLTEQVVAPFVDYLQDRLTEDSDVLYLLERYAHRVEWFEQRRLHAAYVSDTSRGEALYDDDLRRFLFEQGVDFPFSQPRSASGEADVVAGLDGDDPLVCEVKLFDGGAYGIPYVAKGVKQALRYARDYGKTVGYLVVFNLSDTVLGLATDGTPQTWPPRLHVGDHVIHIVVVQGLPLPSASTRGKLTVNQVSRDQLLSEADPAPGSTSA